MSIDEKVIRSLPSLSYIDQVGIAAVEVLKKIPNVLDLEQILPGAKVAIVLSTHMPLDAVERARRPPAENVMSYRLVQYQINREVVWAATDLSGWLVSKGEEAVPVFDMSSRSFPSSGYDGPVLTDLYANAPFAVAAGLGKLGLSGLLLTSEYGPRQRFSFVLTTADLAPTSYEGESLCTKCGKCAAACPVKALSTDDIEEVVIGDKRHLRYRRQETRCRWTRCLGMVPEAGPMYMGWKDAELPIPDELTEEEAKKAIEHKDPLQVKAYRSPFWTDSIVERCLQICPIGTEGNCEKESFP